jgi:hypothetical protein
MSRSSTFTSVRFDRRLVSRVGVGVAVVLSAATLAGIHTDAAAARSSTDAKAGIAVGAEKAVSAARPANGQGPPAVAWNGSRYFVVWAEGTLDTSSIYGARVSADGTVLDPNGILLGTRDSNIAVLRNPTVAGGGGKFFVIWEQEPEDSYDDLFAAMVSNAGVVQKNWCLSCVDNQQSNPSAAWNGQLFLAAWEDTPQVTESDIYGARVTRDGVTLDGCSGDSCPDGDDPGIPIGAVLDTDQIQPAVAGNDSYFVVPWADTSVATPTDIMDAGVAINGSILDSGFHWTISNAPSAQSDPSIARSGDSFLIAWSDRRSDPNSDVYSTLIRPGSEFDFNSTPLSPNGVLVSAANRGQSMPSVARRGTGYLVVWLDRRNSTFDIYGARVNASGAVVDMSGVPIAASGRIETDPAAVAGSGNQLVAYRHPTSGGATRVFFRILT